MRRRWAGLVRSREGALSKSQLHGVSALDPTVFAAVVAVLATAALAACAPPARRATRIDVVRALSHD